MLFFSTLPNKLIKRRKVPIEKKVCDAFLFSGEYLTIFYAEEFP